MNLKKCIIIIGILSIILNPFYISADEGVFTRYSQKDIVVQDSQHYYLLKPILDQLEIKSKVERIGNCTKIILIENNKTYEIRLDEEENIAYTSKGKFPYIVNSSRIGFSSNFYTTILKDSNLLWNAKRNILSIYDKKIQGNLITNLEEYNEEDNTNNSIRIIHSKQNQAQNTSSTQKNESPISYIPYEKGQATWYGAALHGNLTASGERFDMHAFTAAHKTLPFGTKVRVTNLINNNSVVVKITDRGPFAPGRIIDLSQAAAEKIDMLSAGVVPVQLEIIKTA